MGWFRKSPPAPQQLEDPFAEVDATSPFRPRVERAEFFTRTGNELCQLLVRGILDAVDGDEAGLVRRLSPGQRALYLWWTLDNQVRESSFMQYLLGGYAHHVPALIRGLDYIEATATAAIARRAAAATLKTIELAAKNPRKLEKSLYAKVPDLVTLDREYTALQGEALVCIERCARARPEEFCVDEHGAPFASTFTGHIVAHDASGRPRLEVDVEAGRRHGPMRTFYPSGVLRRVTWFQHGDEVGVDEHGEQGELVSHTELEDNGRVRRIETYHSNGQLAEVHRRNVDSDQRIGLEQSWYDNGQLRSEWTWNGQGSQVGAFRRFWRNGRPALDAELVNGNYRVSACWTEDGTRVLENGTGLYINEFELTGVVHREEAQYLNHRRHGTSRSTRDGRITLECTYRDDKEHGVARTYYDNGRVRQEISYRDGERLAENLFDKFERARVRVTLRALSRDPAMPGFVAARLLNGDELARATSCPVKPLLEHHQDHPRFCSHDLEVDARGEVTRSEPWVAELLEVAEPNVKRLRFAPATRDGIAVPSTVRLVHEFLLVDAGD